MYNIQAKSNHFTPRCACAARCNDFGGVRMFGQGIYGCENRKGKGGVASPIDFLCKIENSKFVTCL